MERQLGAFFAANAGKFVMPEKPVSLTKKLPSVSQPQHVSTPLSLPSSSEEKGKVPPAGGLFSRMKAQGLTKKISRSQSSLSKEDEKSKKEAEKRNEFVSKIKPVTKESVQLTPKPKGIKRYFHSEEVKRPVVTETGSLTFQHSEDSPVIARDLFGVKRKAKWIV